MAAPPMLRGPLPRLNIPPPFDARQGIFSPNPMMHPPFPLQTPIQPFFAPPPPNAPPRPAFPHHRGHSSVAYPPAMTPLGQHFPVVVPFAPPFVPRPRRAPSVSLGGPPKAPLGGPGRKHSPLPPPPPPPPPKGKKVAVNLPVETTPGTEERPAWARTPMPTTGRDEAVLVAPETTTGEPYPPDGWRHYIPDTVDVFLPGQVAWDAIRQRVIEEKLERLGVHGRAVSISSPADPSLLYFKLNKLQQSQNASTASSPHQLTPSPGLPPRLQNRHAHSVSFYNPAAAFNPFGPSAVLGSDSIEHDAPTLHAPQGRVPIAPGIRPDFVRGFGLDIPEEDEPQEPAPAPEPEPQPPTEPDATPVAAHSRHVSRLSHALSLRSVGGIHDMPDPTDIVPIRSPAGNPDIDDLDKDAVGEWTGSEDLRLDDDDESIGEWSNPSDEERARHARRVLRQGRHELETPRRLPNFPAPPNSLFGVRVRRDHDLVSNPSEDGLHAEQRAAFLGIDPVDFTLGPSSTSTPGRRPLPPLPHSRDPSAQLSVHDPAAAHSRSPSEPIVPPSVPPVALNPHAKPFVFGFTKAAVPWGSTDGLPLPSPPLAAHARVPSFGKPLNAAAQEFKPTGFTFRPPPGVPQLAFSPPSRPLPEPPVQTSPARTQQGREKRRRRGSHTTVSDDGGDSGKENMASYRFPPVEETPRSVRHTAPSSPRMSGSQDPHLVGPLQPLTFSGFPTDSMRHLDELEAMDLDDDAPNSDDGQLPAVPQLKPKRAPIPLDFKNPPATNTVPAGVFKALVGDEKTRRTVRSRLGSREIFEHSQCPSLDDLAVPAISMSANRSRSRLVTDPGFQRESIDSPDIFTPAIKRRSSLPTMHSAHGSSMSIPAVNLTKRLEAQALEDKLEAMLDDKFRMIRSEIAQTRSTSAATISPTTEDAIAEVVALFRTQLQESAARGLDDSQIDARGELDLELIRDAVQRGHTENLLLLQTELREALARIEQVQTQPAALAPLIEQLSQRHLQAVLAALTPDTRPDTSALAETLLAALGPHLHRAETIDYDALTARLSQAVKPNIEQLIDLAADKRETAGLIVESLVPLLPAALDTHAVTAQIASEVRRVIAPIDAHEIKEQVADLVVARLDARLANRDKALSAEAVASQVVESVLGGLDDVKAVAPRLDALTGAQAALSTQHDALAALVSGLVTHVDGLKHVVEAGQTASAEPPIEAMLSALRQLQLATTAQTPALAHKDDLRALQTALQDAFSERLNALPEPLNAAVSVLQTAHAEFAVSRDAAKCDAEEIRKLKAANNDLQVQLVKARGAHGQVRVEKDNLGERLKEVESNRDALRAQVAELQAAVGAHASEVEAIEARNTDLQDALSQSLARLKASDVAAQAHQERIAELEKTNKDGAAEQQALQIKLGELSVRVEVAEREKVLVAESLRVLRQDYESLVAQQSHWDDLRRVAEQMEALASLRSQVDDDELKELRRAREQHRQLETDHAALQKRVRDQELRAANSERAAGAAKQNLIQAQQRASEWERRAREHEADLETTRNRLDDVEQAQVQLDADYSLAKLQMEEKEAEDRLVKDREYKLRDQVSSLEAQVARLEAELGKAQQAQTRNVPSSYGGRYVPSKNTSPPRPDSRASTVFGGDRARTPVGRGNINGSQTAAGGGGGGGLRSDTPPQSSVWDSMHAPRNPPAVPSWSYVKRVAAPTPSYRAPSVAATFRTRSVASPTPSTVSVTKDEEGWYS